MMTISESKPAGTPNYSSFFPIPCVSCSSLCCRRTLPQLTDELHSKSRLVPKFSVVTGANREALLTMQAIIVMQRKTIQRHTVRFSFLKLFICFYLLGYFVNCYLALML
ncbi:uncharacterized protein DS421_2g37130 [Arachis hypogaea]|nr:uncharacterized protein DS421_2g37130 [Arachis hypogaea]